MLAYLSILLFFSLKVFNTTGFYYCIIQIFTDSNYYHMKQRAVLKQSFQAHLQNVRLRMDPTVRLFDIKISL